LGELPNQQQAQAETGDHAAPTSGIPHLGLQLAPEVDGAGDRGVAVVGVEQGGPAAERGLQTGDIILEVGGKQVAKPADVRDALVAAHKSGRHDVLMRVKTAQAATRFVAVPVG
jgi:serine protease Do